MNVQAPFDPAWIQSVAQELRGAIRRRRITFIHSGACHGGLLASITGAFEHQAIDAVRLCQASSSDLQAIMGSPLPVVVTGIESLCGPVNKLLMSKLRMNVDALVERDLDVCLVSSESKSSFPRAPGSSILLDSAAYVLPLCPRVVGDDIGLSVLPSMRESPTPTLRDVFAQALSQVGLEVLVDLDRVINETGHRGPDSVQYLTPEIQEEMRASGFLLLLDDTGVEFSVPLRFSEFVEALGDAISLIVAPPDQYPLIVQGIFTVERAIRRSLRRAAIAENGGRWRRGLLPPSIEADIVAKVRQDTQPLCSGIHEVRDPLEWVNLGELLDLVRSSRFAGLGQSTGFWNRCAQEVLPIRNRAGHMRLPLTQDAAMVEKWRMLVLRACG